MSLTSLLADRASAVSRFFAEELAFTRGVQADYLASAPDLRFPPCSANPGTVGTTYDWRLRLLLDPHPDIRLALAGVVRIGRPDLALPLVALLQEVGIDDDHGAGVAPSAAMVPGVMSHMDEEFLGRLAWVLACYTEVFRSGVIFPGSPLSRIDADATPADLLKLAPEDACLDVAELIAATKHTLFPVLRRGDPTLVGPTFAGSSAVGGADADVIAGTLLVELKTSAGDRRSDGSRRCSLGKDVLYQMLGYALLDWDDEFSLDSVALYAVRFDYLRTWTIESLVDALRADRPSMTLEQLRAGFRERVDIGSPGEERSRRLPYDPV